MKIYDFRKSNLRTPLFGGLSRSTRVLKFVALYDGAIIGYAESSYTTPREVARIGLVHANAAGRRLSVESLLLNTARSEMEKAGMNRFRIIVPTTQPELIEVVKALGFKEAFVVDGMASELS